MATETPSTDRRLTRSRDDRLLGGVAGGVAEFLGLDPTLVRVGFVLLAVFGGSGIVVYLAMWLLVPPADDSARGVDDNVRAGVGEMRDAARGLAEDVRTGWQTDAEGEAVPAEDAEAPAGTVSQDDEATPVDA